MNFPINIPSNGAEFGGWSVSDQHNYQSAMGYIDDLFKRRSRLLVIRVDFYVHASDPGHSDPEVMKGYLNKFLNNSRCNALFNNQVGYMWGFEYGHLRDYHFHMAFSLMVLSLSKTSLWVWLLAITGSTILPMGQGSFTVQIGIKRHCWTVAICLAS